MRIISVFREDGESVIELQTLSDSFGHMSVRIKILWKRCAAKKTSCENRIKGATSADKSALLYNTLDSIQWMCERGETGERIKMVGALARLFRISISRGHELITIKDEINHVRNYLIIQSFSLSFAVHVQL